MAFSAGQKLRASQMSVYVCTSSTRPAGHSGQIIYETDTDMLAMYTGSVWNYISPTGTDPVMYQSNAASNQSIASGGAIIAFGTDNITTGFISKGTTGAGHYFRLKLPGRWEVSTTIRWASDANSGERYTAIHQAGSQIASQGLYKAAVSSAVTQNLATPVWVPYGSENTSAADIHVSVYHIVGGGATLEANNGSGWGRINLVWLGA